MIRRVSPLYVRMAVYIGAAIVGFVLLALASLALIASQQLENYLLAREGSLGRDAAQVLSRGGRDALREWMADPRTIPAYVGIIIYHFGNSKLKLLATLKAVALWPLGIL